MKPLLIFISIFFLSTSLYGSDGIGDQDTARLDTVRMKLAELVESDPSYGEYVDISVGKLPLSEVFRNVAKATKVNLTVKGAENTMVTFNFSRAKITDMLYFLCREYDLDIDVVGNILAIHPVPQPVQHAKAPNVRYSIAGKTLSYDLNGDLLIDVAKKITSVSGHNVIVPQQLYTKQISGFIEDIAFDEAVFMLASINGLDCEKIGHGTWEIIHPLAGSQKNGDRIASPSYARRSSFNKNQLFVDSLGLVTARIERGNVRDIITDLCEELKLNYFFVSSIDQQTAIYVKQVEFEALLSVMLSGTPYSYYVENDVYVFGTAGKESNMVSARVVPMHTRSVATIVELIPDNLRAGLQIKEFVDLNSFVISGNQKAVSRVETFIRSVDQRVPQVTIEVLIVDATRSQKMESGIGLGVGTGKAKTSGTISPGVDLNLNANSINNILRRFSGFGSINLGRVNNDFYASLKFLEDKGVIELLSTPKLSTLNGHEATLKSGETLYYKEISNTWMGTQNPIQNESFVWKSIEANLSVKIVPFVSSDKHITLNIEIEQTEFTNRAAAEDAPPGTTTRSFKSLIRVQNEEMILLGGIDRNAKEKSSAGLPFIARVPVLRWIFGKTKNNKEEHRLNVFIKPVLTD